MDGLIRYPSTPHVRRHGPRADADHTRYKPWLRDPASLPQYDRSGTLLACG